VKAIMGEILRDDLATMISALRKMGWGSIYAKTKPEQTLLCHTINAYGLSSFLFNLIATKRNWDKNDARLLSLAMLLHDAGKSRSEWQKQVIKAIENYSEEKVPPHKLSFEELRDFIGQLHKCGLEIVLDDRDLKMIYLLSQTLHSLSAPESLLSSPYQYQLSLLSMFVDYLISAESVYEAYEVTISSEHGKAFDADLKFQFHGVSYVHGMITYLFNRAMEEVFRKYNYKPILYFPEGTLYVALKDEAKNIDVETFLDEVATEFCRIVEKASGGAVKRGITYRLTPAVTMIIPEKVKSRDDLIGILEDAGEYLGRPKIRKVTPLDRKKHVTFTMLAKGLYGENFEEYLPKIYRAFLYLALFNSMMKDIIMPKITKEVSERVLRKYFHNLGIDAGEILGTRKSAWGGPVGFAAAKLCNFTPLDLAEICGAREEYEKELSNAFLHERLINLDHDKLAISLCIFLTKIIKEITDGMLIEEKLITKDEARDFMRFFVNCSIPMAGGKAKEIAEKSLQDYSRQRELFFKEIEHACPFCNFPSEAIDMKGIMEKVQTPSFTHAPLGKRVDRVRACKFCRIEYMLRQEARLGPEMAVAFPSPSIIPNVGAFINSDVSNLLSSFDYADVIDAARDRPENMMKSVLEKFVYSSPFDVAVTAFDPIKKVATPNFVLVPPPRQLEKKLKESDENFLIRITPYLALASQSGPTTKIAWSRSGNLLDAARYVEVLYVPSAFVGSVHLHDLNKLFCAIIGIYRACTLTGENMMQNALVRYMTTYRDKAFPAETIIRSVERLRGEKLKSTNDFIFLTKALSEEKIF
jgi:hypothetical protein